MKKKINLVGWLLGAAMITFAACSDDNDNQGSNGGNTPDNLPKPVATSFNRQFPNAINVKWTEKKNHYVATFDLKKNKTRAETTAATNEAWYTKEGKCNLSEQEITVENLKSQYAEVWDTYSLTSYAKDGYKIDDIDLLKRNLSDSGEAEIIVKIEVEKGETEYDLYFTAEGILVKEVPDEDKDDKDDDNLPCPQELVTFIAQNYKDAIIVDFEEETNDKTKEAEYEVEILRPAKISDMSINIEYELLFNKDYKFLGSEIDLDDKAEAALVSAYASKLSKEAFDKLVALIGEKDPAKWDIEIRENTDRMIEIYAEVEKEDEEEQMILIATINPADFGL